MYSNGQWPGHGQQETTDIFQPLVDIMPQLPSIGKMAQGTSAALRRLVHTARSSGPDAPMAAAESKVRSQRA
jgi:hypothetical protein